LERVWRGLKDRLDLFAQYLALFKKSTFKRVVKESITPDIVSSMLAAAKEHIPDRAAQLAVLEGLGAVQNIGLMVSLLPQQDLLCLRQILEQLQSRQEEEEERGGGGEGGGGERGGGGDAVRDKAAELRRVFGV
jgi:hypothetical protein